jgi:two-component system, NtrC family, sensor kinase
VVDDERSYAWAAAFVLGEVFDVTPLESARELLSAIAAGARYDLILADVVMPEMTGFQMLGVLQTVAPEQAERVCFLTALADNVVLPRDMAHRILGKPGDATRLTALVVDRLGLLPARRPD